MIKDNTINSKDFEKSVQFWMQTFQSVLKRKSMYESRLVEFLTWDNCKGNDYMHSVKVEALKRLINN